MQNEDTIAAIASAIAHGIGGVAIIRISGSEAIKSCKKIVKTNSLFAWESHRVFKGFVNDQKEQILIDEILVIVMKSPKSFTGEDIVELHCHGGVVVVNRVFEILLKNSKIRIANPGEFSQRAFLNGKIDLTQAESINQLINAKNIRAAEIAFNGLRGEISKKIDNIKYLLIEQLAEIEARVDFEEDFKEFSYISFEKNLNIVKDKINYLIESSLKSSYLHNGISIALIGKTNVGKSSLLNLLSKENKAIVTSIPGTTRDIIEVNLTIENIPIRFFDTAGIRKTKDTIEKIGIDRSLKMISKSDFILYLYDLEVGFDKYDEIIIEKIPSDKLITIVGNKKDLVDKRKKIIERYSNMTIFMSIKNNYGERELLDKIVNKCKSKDYQNIDILLNQRQINNLQSCLKNLNDTKKIIDNRLPFDLLSIELRDAIKNLSKLSGQDLTEEILENVFSKFCIGK